MSHTHHKRVHAMRPDKIVIDFKEGTGIKLSDGTEIPPSMKVIPGKSGFLDYYRDTNKDNDHSCIYEKKTQEEVKEENKKDTKKESDTKKFMIGCFLFIVGSAFTIICAIPALPYIIFFGISLIITMIGMGMMIKYNDDCKLHPIEKT